MPKIDFQLWIYIGVVPMVSIWEGTVNSTKPNLCVHVGCHSQI